MANVLVVDDSRVVLEQVKQALEADGHAVHCTENPLEVPSLIRRRIPEVVLVDLEMPTLRGEVVANIVRKTFGRDVVVLLLTAASPAEAQRAARACDADGVVMKSEDLLVVRKAVSALRERRRSA